MSFLALPPLLPEREALTTIQSVGGMLDFPTTEIRRISRKRLVGAMQRGRVTPAQVVSAARQGDEGIAALIASHAAPLSCPQLTKQRLPVKKEAPTRNTIAGIKTLVKLLHAEGHVPSGMLDFIADGELSPGDLYRLLMPAWSSLVNATLATNDLPEDLPEHMGTALSVTCTELDALVSNYEEGSGTLSLSISSNVIPYIALRAFDEDYLAMNGALLQFCNALSVPMLADPTATEHLTYFLSEIMEDVENMATWNEAGEPALDLEALNTLLEDTGFGEADEEGRDCYLKHLKYRKWIRENQSFKPGSDQAAAWRKALNNEALASCYDAIIKITDTLLTGKDKRIEHDRAWPPPMTVVALGTGIDDWTEEAINNEFNSGEEAPELRVTIKGNAAQVGSRVKRVLNEVAATNYVTAMIESLP